MIVVLHQVGISSRIGDLVYFGHHDIVQIWQLVGIEAAREAGTYFLLLLGHLVLFSCLLSVSIGFGGRRWW